MQKAEVERLLMKPTARKRLGKYVLLGRLGHGGMGKIYLAFAPGPGGIEKLLVIKRLHSHLTGDPVLVNNFLDEARLSMVLTHPSIVHTYDVGEVDGRYFIVMEYIDGQNLGVLLRTAKRSGNYPDGTLWAGLFLGVLDALHAAHAAKDARGRELHIIHRDVSPQNVLVTYDGMPKLVDFGIAKAALRISETDAGVLKGKYSYMSPEQCQSLQLDPRSDVFSAGIVLWEMLAGRRLYKADSIVKSVERIMTEPPIPPVRVNPDCDVELSKVVLKALQKKPDDRFSSAEEFRYALDDALHRGPRHFRQTEVRDLMERLFHDVRDRQQKLLEACLSGVAEAVDDENVRGSPHDSDSHVPVGSGVSESGSDVHMPNLGVGYENETTTPSSARRSPLVTQEEEDDGARRPVVAAVGSVSNGAPTADRITAPTLLTENARSTSRGTLVAAGAGLGIAILLVGAVALGFASGRFGGDDDVRTAQVSKGVDVIGEKPVGGSGDKNAPTGTATEQADEAANGAAPAKPDEPPPAPAGAEGRGNDEDGAKATDARVEDEQPDRRSRGRSKNVRAKRASSSERSDKKLDDDTVLKSADPKPAAETVESATLTLETVPWSVVYLGKKRLGETPLVNVPIPAGELELLLVNPEKDIRQPYFLKAAPGKSYTKRLKLD